jgi:hypothetical protein
VSPRTACLLSAICAAKCRGNCRVLKGSDATKGARVKKRLPVRWLAASPPAWRPGSAVDAPAIGPRERRDVGLWVGIGPREPAQAPGHPKRGRARRRPQQPSESASSGCKRWGEKVGSRLSLWFLAPTPRKLKKSDVILIDANKTASGNPLPFHLSRSEALRPIRRDFAKC